ncbi:N-6 DNA methylase [Emticicia sp. W12TSBA100-4]|uniref:N-6 DNA methylase n=1 Tax=Emticicia sp. W12TSBA100-4 TaxID=3160965 RepID=UPI00330582C7
MNFQEVIEIVLAGSPKPMTSAEISDSINERKLYLEWKGKPVDAALVMGRAKQHTNLFTVENNYITKTQTSNAVKVITDIVKEIIVESPSEKSDVFVPQIIFWAWVSKNDESLREKYFGDYHIDSFRIMSGIPFRFKLNEVLRLFRSKLFEETNITLHGLNIDGDSLASSLKQLLSLLQTSDYILLSKKEFSRLWAELIGTYQGHIHPNKENALYTITNNVIGNYEFSSLFDPFAGACSLITEVIQDKNSFITLNDVNNGLAFLGWINLLVNDFKNFSFEVYDSFQDNTEEKYDLIVSEPPFNVKVSHDTHDFNPNIFFVHNSKDFTSNAIQLIISKLSYQGKAIVIIPDSFLTTGGVRKVLRQYLIEHDLLQAIISLPTDTFKPISVKTSIIILDKNKSSDKRGRVIIQDFSDKNASLENIVSLTQNWNENLPNNSIIVSNKEFESINGFQFDIKRFTSKLKFGHEYHYLSELIVNSKSGSYADDKKAIKKEFAIEGNALPFISIKDLSNSASEYLLNIEEVEKNILLNIHPFQKSIIDQSSILVAKIGNKLKPTYFDGNSNIVISSNVLALFPNTKLVLSEYLISQLNENYVLEQIEQIRVGAAQPYWRISDFLNIKIKLASLEEQEKALAQYYKDKFTSAEVLISDEQKKNEEFEIKLLASLQHELKGQVLQPLVQEISILKRFLNRKANESLPFSWKDKSTPLPNSRNVEDVFSHIDDVILTANNLFNNMQAVIELDKKKLNKRKIDLISFIKNEVSKFGDSLNGVTVSYKINNIIEGQNSKRQFDVEIDTEKFSNVISNFIRNSLLHGFDDSIHEKHIVFAISRADKDIILDLIDNGKGFPPDFSFNDYVTFGIKSRSKGAGIGGYLMKRTVEIHDGILLNIDNEQLIPLPQNIHQKDTEKVIISGVHFKIYLPTKNN